MDLYAEDQMDRELFSFEVKERAGYGKTGEKNFEGEVTNLQMQTYLTVRDFRRRKNKQGNEYGWGIAIYCTPEHLWGYEHITSEYRIDPKESAMKIFFRVKELYPEASDRDLRKVLGIRDIGGAGEKEKKVIPYPDNLIKALRIEGLTAETMTEDQKAGLLVAIGQLRDKQQRTIRMKYMEHQKNDAIGKVMNRSAGTIGTYHTKAMGKLRWPSVAAWYLDGYDKTIRMYLQKKNLFYPDEILRDDNEAVSGRDYCLRLGISLKSFDSLLSRGVVTVFDLILAAQNPEWYKPLPGIGPKTAADIEEKLDRLYIQKLEKEPE